MNQKVRNKMTDSARIVQNPQGTSSPVANVEAPVVLKDVAPPESMHPASIVKKLAKSDNGSLIIPSSYERFLRGKHGAALQHVNKCPVQNCDGSLRLTVCGGDNSKPWYMQTFMGGVGKFLTANYVCNKCGVRFQILNPRSFCPPGMKGVQ